MKDITPLIPIGRKMIESYGNGAFKISGVRYENNVIILPASVHKFESKSIAETTSAHIQVIEDNAGDIEVLLVGGGKATEFLPAALEANLRQKNIAVEYMDTGAAARTYNVLLSEERKVAVVLIAV